MLKYTMAATLVAAVAAVAALAAMANPFSPDSAAHAAPTPTFEVQVACAHPNANQVSVSVDAHHKPGIRSVQIILLRGAPGPVAQSETPFNVFRGRLPKGYVDTVIMEDPVPGDWDTYQVRVILYGRHKTLGTFNSPAVSC
jgi:hypothetical protein